MNAALGTRSAYAHRANGCLTSKAAIGRTARAPYRCRSNCARCTARGRVTIGSAVFQCIFARSGSNGAVIAQIHRVGYGRAQRCQAAASARGVDTTTQHIGAGSVDVVAVTHAGRAIDSRRIGQTAGKLQFTRCVISGSCTNLVVVAQHKGIAGGTAHSIIVTKGITGGAVHDRRVAQCPRVIATYLVPCTDRNCAYARRQISGANGNRIIFTGVSSFANRNRTMRRAKLSVIWLRAWLPRACRIGHAASVMADRDIGIARAVATGIGAKRHIVVTQGIFA